jgi:AcrR family transcriptional regulator
VARPKIPLISKRASLQVALDIIDEEGLGALSIRRLAEQLKVNGASLYHHFKNKDEIVVGAAKLALEEVRVPQGHEEPWRVWILRNARRLRAALVAHPDLAPIMLRREPLGIGTSRLDATVALLEYEGVPIGAIAPMLEALELYAIGSALHEISDTPGEASDVPESGPRTVQHGPNLTRAIAQRAVSADDIFDVVCEQIMDVALRAANDGLDTAAGRTAPPRQRKSPQKRPTPSKPERVSKSRPAPTSGKA